MTLPIPDDPDKVDKWLLWISAKWKRRGWRIAFMLVAAVLLSCIALPMYNLHKRAKHAEGTAESLRTAAATNEANLAAQHTENLRLARQVQDQQAVIIDAKKERDEAKRERDQANAALAPWVLLANSVISNAPPDKRLDILLQKVEPLAKVLETVQSLTNAQQRNAVFELWAEGLHLTNQIYFVPLDSNRVARINFRVKNIGNDVAENVRMFVGSPTVTNLSLSGPFWQEPPLREDPGKAVFADFSRGLNPHEGHALGTLHLTTDGSMAYVPFAVQITSARASFVARFAFLCTRSDGMLTALEPRAESNGLREFFFDADRLIKRELSTQTK